MPAAAQAHICAKGVKHMPEQLQGYLVNISYALPSWNSSWPMAVLPHPWQLFTISHAL